MKTSAGFLPDTAVPIASDRIGEEGWCVCGLSWDLVPQQDGWIVQASKQSLQIKETAANRREWEREREREVDRRTDRQTVDRLTVLPLCILWTGLVGGWFMWFQVRKHVFSQCSKEWFFTGLREGVEVREKIWKGVFVYFFIFLILKGTKIFSSLFFPFCSVSKSHYFILLAYFFSWNITFPKLTP